LPLTQGCAMLALGYFRWLPTGAGRWAGPLRIAGDDIQITPVGGMQSPASGNLPGTRRGLEKYPQWRLPGPMVALMNDSAITR
jgi:hypothetical protein